MSLKLTRTLSAILTSIRTQSTTYDSIIDLASQLYLQAVVEGGYCTTIYDYLIAGFVNTVM